MVKKYKNRAINIRVIAENKVAASFIGHVVEVPSV